MKEFDEFIERVAESLDRASLAEFRWPERICLKRHMELIGMTDYPAVTGDPQGERADGRCVCEVCNLPYFDHPPDWRVIGYGNVPFLTVLCDGRRVKL